MRIQKLEVRLDRLKTLTRERFEAMVVLHGNGEDIYFLISPRLPISPSPHLRDSPSPYTPGASFTITRAPPPRQLFDI
ncbi:MAG: hypothetical protein F6K22_05650 [Okeania sp. SIO2F4]|uniref:hypothetical protein n=1 Tax=Okeania sp. SIO2F4 TaxID=2607790 RepID=UPI00142CB695|nr:hypothetical protein [Okeania sp. SIO2F4]NES02366.1 hypothetical protein [Okeania sp. SIO2F4]